MVAVSFTELGHELVVLEHLLVLLNIILSNHPCILNLDRRQLQQGILLPVGYRGGRVGIDLHVEVAPLCQVDVSFLEAAVHSPRRLSAEQGLEAVSGGSRHVVGLGLSEPLVKLLLASDPVNPVLLVL